MMVNSARQTNRGTDPGPHRSLYTNGEQVGELSDADLEQVVGGLSRAWHVDGPMYSEPAPIPLSVTTLPSIDVARRVSA